MLQETSVKKEENVQFCSMFLEVKVEVEVEEDMDIWSTTSRDSAFEYQFPPS